MPSKLHNRISQHFASLGFSLPGERPTLREAIASATGETLEAMRREHLKVPSPDAWKLDHEFRTVICIEVDITHRAKLRKYAPLWRWLDAGDWRLYVVRANHEGIVWPVDIMERALEHAEGRTTPQADPTPPPDERERYDTVLGRHGVRLYWPSLTEDTVIRMRQRDGTYRTLTRSDAESPEVYPGHEPSDGALKFNAKTKPADRVTMTLYYGDEEPPP